MKSDKFGIGLVLAGVALTLMGGRAAQAAEETTSTTTTTTTTGSTPVAAPDDHATTPPAPAQRGMTLPGAQAEPAVETTDHAAVVRRFGIGYMGRRTININPTGAPATVDAPIIGVRYWLDPLIGIDAGIGLLFSGGSTNQGDTSTDQQGFTVFMVHGGVPLSLAASKHFSFQVTPELNLGFAGSKTATAPNGQRSDLSGIHFDIGARGGGEVQFGFIGIPELSLQAGIGLSFSYDHSKITPPGGGMATSVNTTSLGTSVGNNPWNIFTSNIAALYYF
ncbi:MAG TPA: hypothetical protein VFK05_39055 [Polyangiaceae bacterium]|nr:hypothetical protein [Polyangiaceae bacterium]